MKEEIVIIHPVSEDIKRLQDILQEKKRYKLAYFTTPEQYYTSSYGQYRTVVFLSTRVDGDSLIHLQKITKELNKRVIILNFDRPTWYIVEYLQRGAINCFNANFNYGEISILIDLHFNSFDQAGAGAFLSSARVNEKKKLVLNNFDIYDSGRVDVILDYLLRDIKNKLNYEVFIGLANAIYEILINAMEHGNCGIDTKLKEELLKKNEYDDFLKKKMEESKKKVEVTLNIRETLFRISIEDEGSGFLDHSFEVKKDPFRLSGRGLAIAKYYFDKVRFEKNGSKAILIKTLEKN